METTTTACEIARLPEELLSAAISRTTPRDACRAAAVSPAFRAAADSDAVWSAFLPRDLELSPAPPSKKGLFLRLSDSARPVLLPGGLTGMWLDRETGAKCYMLSARALHISWGNTPKYWRWIPLTDSRFSEGAELKDVCWLEIRGNIHSMMLSKKSTYAVYIVFKIANDSYGLKDALCESSVSVGGSKSARKVRLQSYDSENKYGYYNRDYSNDYDYNYAHEDEDDDEDEEEEEDDYNEVLENHCLQSNCGMVPPGEHISVSQERADGWLELEIGEFYNEKGEDGKLCFSLKETKKLNWKKGLLVHGIDVRPKESA